MDLLRRVTCSLAITLFFICVSGCQPTRSPDRNNEDNNSDERSAPGSNNVEQSTDAAGGAALFGLSNGIYSGQYTQYTQFPNEDSFMERLKAASSEDKEQPKALRFSIGTFIYHREINSSYGLMEAPYYLYLVISDKGINNTKVNSAIEAFSINFDDLEETSRTSKVPVIPFVAPASENITTKELTQENYSISLSRDLITMHEFKTGLRNAHIAIYGSTENLFESSDAEVEGIELSHYNPDQIHRAIRRIRCELSEIHPPPSLSTITEGTQKGLIKNKLASLNDNSTWTLILASINRLIKLQPFMDSE